jgi:hypothetical protein
MLSHKPSIETITKAYAAKLGIYKLEALQAQPPHYAFRAGDRYIIKALVTPHPEIEAKKLIHRIALARRLREQGADITEFPMDPTIYEGVILLAIPFYPHALPDNPAGYALFGKAVASLHIAGKKLAPTDISELTTIDPLPVIWESFHFLVACEQKGMPFAIESTAFPEAALPVFEHHLLAAQKAYDELLRRTEADDAFTVLYQDVHPGNIRLDEGGNPRIIDLLDNFVKGPPEYDLARPNGQWTHRIKRDPQLLDAFMKSYQETTAGLYTIDPKKLHLAITVADMYYAASMLKNAIRAYRLGNPSTAEWQITDAVDRILHLDDPSYPWRSTVK